MDYPRVHIVIPVQIADGHQRKRWTASGMCSLVYLLFLTREGIEVDNRNFWGGAWEIRNSFAAKCKGVHIGSSVFYIGNCYLLKFKSFPSLYSK